MKHLLLLVLVDESCCHSLQLDTSAGWPTLQTVYGYTARGGEQGPSAADEDGYELCFLFISSLKVQCPSNNIRKQCSSILSCELQRKSTPPHAVLSAAGWSGSGGLGAKEQGIQDPIKGGDVRDKWDQYKGVGVSLDDPYENYRRNKSYNFVARMKAREEGT